MNVLLFVLICIYGLFFLLAIGLLIFFIVKRIKAKKLEDFEKRDN